MTGLIPVADALARVFDLLAPLGSETVPLRRAAGRILAGPLTAARAQPPFRAASMDGYALRAADARPGSRLRVVGTAAAGRRHPDPLAPGTAVRTFTGAPVPDGADIVVMQEDTTRDGDDVVLAAQFDPGPHIRPAGADFAAGFAVDHRRPLAPADIALLAAMNIAEVSVARRPVVALIATGDELVMPGDAPGPDQIFASNTLGLAAMVEAAGGIARLLPIARDTVAALDFAFDLARGSDLIVTVGGASVGDHDLVAGAAAARGMDRAFYKVAMRPGKPLMAGRLDGVPMLGLPGNPVSALVCGHVFLRPAIAVLSGGPARPASRLRAPLAAPVGPNGAREHYARATLGPDGLTLADQQDSALLSVLAGADALAIRRPHDPGREAGETLDYLPLRHRMAFDTNGERG